MVDVMVEFENASAYLPVLKINLLFANHADERKVMDFVLDFIKVNKLEIIPFEDNPYPSISLDYPFGVAIFAQFKNWQEAVEFTTTCKIP